MPDPKPFQLRPTADPRSFRVFVGRLPIGCVTKEPMGWRPDGGVPTDVRPSKETAAARLVEMRKRTYAD